MRKILLAQILMFTCATCFSQIHSPAGSWLGTLDVGVKLRLVFKIKSETATTFSATMDSPDQGAKGIPVSSVIVGGDSLHLGVDVIKGGFDGKFVNDTTVSGTWAQGAVKVPLTIVKTKEIAALNRPQTPEPPFSYTSEDVEYFNADKSVHFGGTFTYPATGGNFPTAILITGSGQQDRDETIFEHKPFAVIADYLTKKGYAILRVDDRGVGKTTGDAMAATSADFAKDVRAGVDYLKTRKEADKNKIGLIGHSEGGMIAPMVAANNKDIAFIVLWGAAVVGGLEVNTAQNAHALQNSGFSDAPVKAFSQLHRKELALFKTADNVTVLNKNILTIFKEWSGQQPEAILQALSVKDSSILGQSVYKMYDGLFELPWMRFFINHDFKGDLAKVKCPVLAINGEKDTQVDAATNLAAIDSILKANHQPAFKTVSLKGLNHLLQTANTGDVSEYKTIEETISPQALAVIASWLDETVKKK